MYGDWKINGIPLNCIIKPKIDPVNRTITFNCLADVNATGADPRVEIATFQNLTSNKIHNDDLLNGGTKLQVKGGNVVTIVEETPLGDVTYTAALEGIVVEENNYSNQAIEYNIIAHYELSGSGKSFVYVPSYRDYSNIELHEWYYLSGETWIKEDCTPTQGGYGSEIGWMQIVETKQVKKVEVYGSGCRLPASVTVDGSVEGTQNWIYQHDVNPDTNVPPNDPFQKLTYNFPEGSFPTILTIYAATGQCPTHVHHNHGAWLKWIKVTYA